MPDTDDIPELSRRVVELAAAQGVLIATAESCTGGLIGGALTDVAGSSAVFDRGFITYSNAAKAEMLKVPASLIDTHGAVSEEVAGAMARGAVEYSEALLAVSVTGIAGPTGGTKEKPVGLVCFGLADETTVTTERVKFTDEGRHAIRAATVAHALSLILKKLQAGVSA